MKKEYFIEKINEDIQNDFNRIQNLFLNFNKDIKKKKYCSNKDLMNSVNWFMSSLNRCIKDYRENFSIAKKNSINTSHYQDPLELNYLLKQN